MPWLIILGLMFSLLHFVLLLPATFAVAVSVVFTAILWIVWKLKWVILGIIGLEELFGGFRGNDGGFDA
jgi:hypothetical protein